MGTNMSPKRPVNPMSLIKNLPINWSLDKFLKALEERCIECSIDIVTDTSDTEISFKIRHRRKDKKDILGELKAMFGHVTKSK